MSHFMGGGGPVFVYGSILTIFWFHAKFVVLLMKKKNQIPHFPPFSVPPQNMKNNIPWPFELTKDTLQSNISEVLEKVGTWGGGGVLGGDGLCRGGGVKVKTSEIIYLCSIYCLLVFLIYSFFLFVCFVLVWFGLGWIFVYLLPEYDSSAVSSRLETGFSLLPSSCLSVCLSRSVQDLTVSLLSHSMLVSLMSPGSDSLSPFLRRWSPSFRRRFNQSFFPYERLRAGNRGRGWGICEYLLHFQPNNK